MTEEEFTPIYCPDCGEDFKMAVDEDGNVVVICGCRAQMPWNFVDDIESQLPLPEEVDEKINKQEKPDRDSSKGFQ